ncbi:MAG: hypothetical protein GTO45_11935 [Candidatus Aminicenantes bacterium]|nr:hypothetical protein [Candidatus Aminicenantes bacterium]NIM84024.1 hypothetical protein [Candidatus Aminicenantes bacterium]NIN18802.1 hypothetical protein [Candidatus Aminicenantes bacterium]NIN42724.1 hypothetical protein [Candidatus Aminicenantes bacterium]NIN85458.1 hypothetical protein [Candidatus Aminicenantes bacterium]
MDFVFIIFIASIVLPIVSWVVWFFFIRWIVENRNTISSATRGFDEQLLELEQFLYDFEALSKQKKNQMKPEILSMFMQANNQLNQLAGIHRQQYELRVSELQGMAANAGIDWTPSSY